MGALLHKFFEAAIDWFFRRRSPALQIMRIGLACLGLAFGAGFLWEVSLPWREGQIEITIDSAGGTPAIIVYLASCVGFGLILVGLIWEIVREREERRTLARKRVLVIEARGLRDTSGSPLIDAVPKDFDGHREQILLDLRQRVCDGRIVDPDAVVDRVKTLPHDLNRRLDGVDRSDVSLVYGGLAPVPLTFLTGILIDDEGAMTIMDWDRHAENWRALDDEDDGDRFEIVDSGLETGDTSEVALAVSVSYQIDLEGVRDVMGETPVVKMSLARGSPDCHWSDAKQRALGQQFLETAIMLGNSGVKRIHLFIAAQNSIVFRFGRLYDKRNLPELIVYQYERGAHPAYPWAVRMPTAGLRTPEVVDNRGTSSA